jgi:N-methylhydantoinase A/oxoprolinase/acetone carboxylase beta subunit
MGPVFSAFGSSVSDIVHVYEEPVHLSLLEGDIDVLNRVIDSMRAAGVRDLRGEGIRPEAAQFSVELELSSSCSSAVQVKIPAQPFAAMNDLRAFLASRLAPKHTVIELVRLEVRKPIARPALMQRTASAQSSAPALTGTRQVAYGSKAGRANIYKWEALQPGATVEGCALLESENSSYFIPEGWSMSLDGFGNAQLSRHAGQAVATSVSAMVQETDHAN